MGCTYIALFYLFYNSPLFHPFRHTNHTGESGSRIFQTNKWRVSQKKEAWMLISFQGVASRARVGHVNLASQVASWEVESLPRISYTRHSTKKKKEKNRDKNNSADVS